MKQAEHVQCIQHTHGNVEIQIMPWYDEECKTYRNTFLRAKRNPKKNTKPPRHSALQAARTTYSKCCNAKKAVHVKQITEAHMKLKYENPRLFWKAVKPNNNMIAR